MENGIRFDLEYETMPWHRVDAVVFDIGNILIRYAPNDFLKQLFPGDEQKQRDMMARVYRGPFWENFDRGTMEYADAAQKLVERFGGEYEDYMRALTGWIELKTPIDEGFRAARRCRRAGKRLYLLSNYPREGYRRMREKFADEFGDLFDGGVISSACHFVKPEKEIYEKLIYDGEEHVSIASLGEDIFKQTIVINGVSKSYAMTGWRIGYTAGPTEVIKAMSSLQSQVASGSNSIAQYAAEEALRSPKGPEEIERMHKAYDERRRHIVSRLNAIDGLKCVMPKGAFYVMVDMSALIGKHLGDRKIAGSMDFADMLLENANVALTPGTAFCAEGYCRISYATSMEQIDKGVDRIEHFVNSLV